RGAPVLRTALVGSGDFRKFENIFSPARQRDACHEGAERARLEKFQLVENGNLFALVLSIAVRGAVIEDHVAPAVLRFRERDAGACTATRGCKAAPTTTGRWRWPAGTGRSPE